MSLPINVKQIDVLFLVCESWLNCASKQFLIQCFPIIYDINHLSAQLFRHIMRIYYLIEIESADKSNALFIVHNWCYHESRMCVCANGFT